MANPFLNMFSSINNPTGIQNLSLSDNPQAPAMSGGAAAQPNQFAGLAELFKQFLSGQQQQPRQTFADARDALRPFRPDMNGYDRQAKESDQIAEENKAWAARFPTAVQRAQREADYFGIPVEQTNTGAENRLRAMTPEQRFNERLGFTPDMTPEQKHAILANQASLATGKPVSAYYPRVTGVTDDGFGGKTLQDPNGSVIGTSHPGTAVPEGGYSTGTINGEPVKSVLAPFRAQEAAAVAAAQPPAFDQAAWERENPAAAAAIRQEQLGYDPKVKKALLKTVGAPQKKKFLFF